MCKDDQDPEDEKVKDSVSSYPTSYYTALSKRLRELDAKKEEAIQELLNK